MAIRSDGKRRKKSGCRQKSNTNLEIKYIHRKYMVYIHSVHKHAIHEYFYIQAYEIRDTDFARYPTTVDKPQQPCRESSAELESRCS